MRLRSVCMGLMVTMQWIWMTTGAVGNEMLILTEGFLDDPVALNRAQVTAGDADRFTFDGVGNTLTASYDTVLDTAKLAWQLPMTLDQNTGFRFDVGFTLLNVSAIDNGFAQIGFGLINSTTTGNDRVGGGVADGYDVVTVDYFPNVSPTFGGPTLSPTVVETDDGVSGFLQTFDDPNTPNVDESSPGSIIFPFGQETDLTDEGSLPEGTQLHASLTYDEALRLLTLRTDGEDINSVGDNGTSGGQDGDIHTIQSFLPDEAEFFRRFVCYCIMGRHLWHQRGQHGSGGCSVRQFRGVCEGARTSIGDDIADRRGVRRGQAALVVVSDPVISFHSKG